MPLTRAPLVLSDAPVLLRPKLALVPGPVMGLPDGAYPARRLSIRQIAPITSINATSVTVTFARPCLPNSWVVWGGGFRTTAALIGSSSMVDQVITLIAPGSTQAAMGMWMGRVARAGTTVVSSGGGADTRFGAAVEVEGMLGLTDQAVASAVATGLSVTPSVMALYFAFIYCNGFVGGGPSQSSGGQITVVGIDGRGSAAFGIVMPGIAISRAWASAGGSPRQGVVTLY